VPKPTCVPSFILIHPTSFEGVRAISTGCRSLFTGRPSAKVITWSSGSLRRGQVFRWLVAGTSACTWESKINTTLQTYLDPFHISPHNRLVSASRTCVKDCIIPMAVWKHNYRLMWEITHAFNSRRYQNTLPNFTAINLLLYEILKAAKWAIFETLCHTSTFN